MDKKILLLVYTLIITFYVRGQSISPMVIANSGTYVSTGTNSLEFTLGELAVSTLNNTGNIITQGFHQTYTGSSYINEEEVGFTVNVYPNPTYHEVNVVLNSLLPMEFTAVVYDSYGRQIFNSSVSSSSKLTLDFTTLAAGTYFITLHNSINHLSIKTIQIQKLSNQ